MTNAAADLCDACQASAVPGALFIAPDGADDRDYVQRCDTCHVFADDAAAAGALGTALGRSVATRDGHPYLLSTDPTVALHQLVADLEDAAFEAGEWDRDESDEPYDAVWQRSIAARDRLLAEIASQIARARRDRRRARVDRYLRGAAADPAAAPRSPFTETANEGRQ